MGLRLTRRDTPLVSRKPMTLLSNCCEDRERPSRPLQGERRAAKKENVARWSVAYGIAISARPGGRLHQWTMRVECGDEPPTCGSDVGVQAARQRWMIDEQHPGIVIDLFDAEAVMRVPGPMRVFDARNIRVMIVMVRVEMDVRWRQERRRDSRRHTERGKRGAAEA